jgi:hypothetical protein
MGADRWSSLQVAIQQQFWPGISDADASLAHGLNAVVTGISMLCSIAGGPVAGATKDLIGGLSREVTLSMKASDVSLKNLASLEKWEFCPRLHRTVLTLFRSADDYIQAAYANIINKNNDLMSTGSSEGTSLDYLFVEGQYLDYRNIAVLNTDTSRFQVSTTELNDLWFRILLSGLVNYAWKQQNVLIVSYPMSQDECKLPRYLLGLYSVLTNAVNGLEVKAGSNDIHLKTYYNGRGYYYQRWVARL